jgi:biopolymer transport protein ExbD
VARIKRTIAIGSRVPTTSMADIAFLLLIFFMVTTIFKLEQGLPVTLPRAEAGQPAPRQRITHIWVLGDQITIEDNLVGVADIAPILVTKLSSEPGLVVGLNIDENTPWEIAALVIEQMKEANAQDASFTSDLERKR